MRVLLDTHVWLWWVSGAAISGRAADVIGDRHADVRVSAASVWEASIKYALGKLPGADGVPDPGDDGFDGLPISVDHAAHAGSLPPHHRDPFDRMLVAQAQLEDLTLVTRDPRLSAYDIPIISA